VQGQRGEPRERRGKLRWRRRSTNCGHHTDTNGKAFISYVDPTALQNTSADPAYANLVSINTDEMILSTDDLEYRTFPVRGTPNPPAEQRRPTRPNHRLSRLDTHQRPSTAPPSRTLYCWSSPPPPTSHCRHPSPIPVNRLAAPPPNNTDRSSLTPSENELGPSMGISGQIWHIYGDVRDFLEAD